MKSCLSLSFDNHERDVVRGARPLRKLRQRRLDAIAYAGRRRFDVSRHDLVQSRRAKLFTRRTNRFGNTIRIDDEHVAMLQLRASLAILSIALDPQRQTARRELFDSAGRVN